MAEIVLSTLNAKYIHAAFGLRYLLANLGPLQRRACLAEFDITQRPADIAERLLAHDPKIIGLGIYIWNVAPATEVVALLKRLRPDVLVILGGPEVSYETDEQAIVKLADYVISGEADLKFAEVCGQLLAGNRLAQKVIPAGLPDFTQLALPYELYDDQDAAHRIIYVEASRGCPFTCEFCLSSLDIPVRQIPLAVLLPAFQRLLDRGVKQFKFVDRTFNLNIQASRAILEFFLERWQPGLFLHFEMIPDRLPSALRETITRFPTGALQFEVGIQTFNESTAALIKRRQNCAQLAENLRFLREQTGVYVHADLIAGLPGENMKSFAAGFDRLVGLGPQEIQVGLLKRLRGTPIVRHDQEWRMIYNPSPPYEILQNNLIDFATMQNLRRFARYWDLVGNSGNFVETVPLLWKHLGAPASTYCTEEFDGSPREIMEHGARVESARWPISRGEDAGAPRSPFGAFMAWSEWLYHQTGRSESIALLRLMELLFNYLTKVLGLERGFVAHVLWRDYQRGGRIDKPVFLKNYLPSGSTASARPRSALPKRQARHLASSDVSDQADRRCGTSDSDFA